MEVSIPYKRSSDVNDGDINCDTDMDSFCSASTDLKHIDNGVNNDSKEKDAVNEQIVSRTFRWNRYLNLIKTDNIN